MSKKKWPGKILTKFDERLVCKLDGDQGSEVVLKVKFGTDPMLKNMVDREKVALDVLKGLAVPKRIILKRDKVAKLFKEKDFSFLAMEYIPWEGCFGKRFSPANALGLWAFTIEQMCAFHRKSILYTDFKHNHLRVAKDLSEARIVDFDGCLMVEPQGLYPTEFLGFTGELAAPEFHFLKVHTERIVVYQMGMFLGALLLKYFHNSDIHSVSLKKIKAKLESVHAKEIYGLFEKCLSKNPGDRPRNLEDLFAKLQNLVLPQPSYELWKRLRTPFLKSLSKLKFKDPKSPLIKTYAKAA